MIKYVAPVGLLNRIGGGADRHCRLWGSGIFDRIPAEIDHATLAVEPTEDGWLLVMRDVSPAVLTDERVLTREESRRILRAVDALHREFWGESVEGAASLGGHYAAFFQMRTLADEFPIAKLFARGWELFPDVAPPDIALVMEKLVTDASPLVAELENHPSTFIHGDLRLQNLGLTPDRVVILDWEIAANAPPAVEFAWYLIISATRIDATREEIIDDFREISGDHFDERALELGLIGGLASLGWNKALDIVENPDPAVRVQERADLDWWIARVREALETWSPV